MDKIILKRNNTPVKPGNYAYANYKGGHTYTTIVRERHRGESRVLFIYVGEANVTDVSSIEFWSDEITNIEFEESEPVQDHIPDATKKVPERLRQGWLEYEERVYSVIESAVASEGVIVTPRFFQWGWLSDDALKIHGIEIHWHDEPQAVDGKAESRTIEVYTTGPEKHRGVSSIIYFTDVPEGSRVTCIVHEPEPQPIEIEPGQRWKVEYPNVTYTVQQNGKWWQIAFDGCKVACIGTDEHHDTKACYEKADLQACLKEHAEFVPEGE